MTKRLLMRRLGIIIMVLAGMSFLLRLVTYFVYLNPPVSFMILCLNLSIILMGIGLIVAAGQHSHPPAEKYED
jgi:hypothetical protein